MQGACQEDLQLSPDLSIMCFVREGGGIDFYGSIAMTGEWSCGRKVVGVFHGGNTKTRWLANRLTSNASTGKGRCINYREAEAEVTPLAPQTQAEEAKMYQHFTPSLLQLTN